MLEEGGCRKEHVAGALERCQKAADGEDKSLCDSQLIPFFSFQGSGYLKKACFWL